MNGGASTSRSVRSVEGVGERAFHWLLLDGNRIAVTAALVAPVAALLFVLARFDLLAIGPGSAAATAFASGLISGTVTLVTIALSINQLILSRVFGSPNELSDRLDGTLDLREQVRDRAGESTVPTDPASFLGLLAATLAESANRLASAVADAGGDAPSEVEDYARGIAAYGENIEGHVEGKTAIVDVLAVILGSEYATNMTATEYVQNEYGGRLSETAEQELDAIADLLESIAVTRQFFKTLSLQQDFARLSRVVAYTGLVALTASIALALVYRTSSVTFPAAYLPLVFSLGVGVILAPLGVFIAYVFRAATIARHTLSVGPFVPPGERTDGE